MARGRARIARTATIAVYGDHLYLDYSGEVPPYFAPLGSQGGRYAAGLDEASFRSSFPYG